MTSGPAEERRRLSVTLAAVGFLLSLLLLGVHASTYLAPGRGTFCSATATVDCTAVAASRYSVFAGLPWAVWGAAGYLSLLVASVRRSRWLLPLAGLAAAASLGLLVVSLTQVGAVCLLCEGAHLVAFTLLFFAVKGRTRASESLTDRQGLLAIWLFPALLVASTWVVLPRYWTAFSYRGEPHLPTGRTSEGYPFIGAVSPRLVVDEFTDYQCPHCKAASTRSLRLLDRYRDVQLVRHDTPRRSCGMGLGACLPARAAICAEAQGKFWQADRWLFTFADGRTPLDLAAMARDLHLDLAQLTACFASEQTHQEATARFEYARKHKARFVPSYLINGKRIEAADLEATLKPH